jgi:hypothetical protein
MSMFQWRNLFSLAGVLVCIPFSSGQPIISTHTNPIEWGMNGSGYFYRLRPNSGPVNCSFTDALNFCPFPSGDNFYVWYRNYVKVAEGHGLTEISGTQYSDSTAFMLVYAYPNQSTEPSYVYSTVSGTASPDSWSIVNKKPQIYDAHSVYINEPSGGPARCMQIYVSTSNPLFKWYKKVSGVWQVVSETSCGGATSSHLSISGAETYCTEWKCEVWNSITSGTKSYAIFYCLPHTTCVSCPGGAQKFNQP